MRYHSNWIRAYLNYTRLLESPDQFHIWAAIGTIAGALRGKCFFDMGHFRWTPNFFIIFVAPPGIASKSTSAGVGMRLLRGIEDVRFGSNSITWQAIIKDLQEAAIGVEVEPHTYQTFCSITYFASELGTLLNMDDRSMLDALTDLWDGSLSSDTWSRRTMQHGKQVIENPWINIMACTTPEWINNNVKKSAIGGGFISRCVFVYGDQKRRLSAYPKWEAIELGADLEAERKPLADDLAQIAALQGEFQLTPGARAFGEAWYHAHNRREKGPFGADMAGYMTRKQAHMHKLAMVVSAAKSNSMQVTEEDLNEALALLESSEAYMPRVFKSIHASVEMGKAFRILDYLDTLPGRRCPKNVLYGRFMAEMQYIEFSGFLEALVNSGEVRIEEAGGMLHVVRAKKEEVQ